VSLGLSPSASLPPANPPPTSIAAPSATAIAGEKERDDLRAELELLRQTARAEAEDHQRTVAELTTMREKLAALELEIEPLRTAATHLEQAVTELAMLRAAEDDQDDVADLMQQLATHEAAAKTARAEVEALQGRIKKSEEVHAVSMAWRESELQREYEEALAQVRLEAEARQLAPPQANGDVEKLRARVAELEAVISGRVSDMEKLRAAKQSADALAVAEQDRADGLQAKLTQAEAQVATLRVEMQQRGDGAADAAQWRQKFEESAQELSQLRPKAAELDQALAALAEARSKLEAAQSAPATGDAALEAVRTQTRNLLELTRAVEPFLWGLEQATAFFGDANVDGGQRHIHSLRLLHKTLQKLKAEIEKVH
jgi:DNA repair exonuclease SbcCD ATPase subunit